MPGFAFVEATNFNVQWSLHLSFSLFFFSHSSSQWPERLFKESDLEGMLECLHQR